MVASHAAAFENATLIAPRPDTGFHMHAAIHQAMEPILRNEPVPAGLMTAAFAAIMDGEAAEIDIAALLTGLCVKGETFEEIAAVAAVMRERSTKIPCQ